MKNYPETMHSVNTSGKNGVTFLLNAYKQKSTF